MSNVSFWQWLLAELKSLLAKAESELAKAAVGFGQVVNAVITAEESQIMSDVTPMVKQIAINLQNTAPGLNGKDFVSALIAAAIPVLQAEGVKLSHTAIAIIAATVAHGLEVPDQTGNAGVIGGATPLASASA